MVLPINFILNFQVNAAKASQGITKMSVNTEHLAKTWEQVHLSFADWAKSVPEGMKLPMDTFLTITDYVKKLNGVFSREIKNEWGKGLNEEFVNMQKNLKMIDLQKSFESMADKLKFMAPHIEQTNKGLIKMFESMVSLRKTDGPAMEALSKNLEKIGKTFNDMKPKQQQAMQKLFETFAKSKKSVKDLKLLEGSLDNIIKKQEGIDELKGAFADLFGFLPNGVDSLKQIARAAGAYTVFQDAAEAQQKMVTTLTQLGMVQRVGVAGAWDMYKATNAWTSSVLNLGWATQVSMKEATEAMSALANQRITTNITDMEELAVTSVRMGQAFGMSTDQATEFIGALYKIGGLSKTEVAGAADMMANIQDQLGLTASEASASAAQIGSMVRTMKAFGGRVKDVESMVKGVTKLNVAFTKVGLSADEANQMLTSMLNPDDLEKNILLFQGLGMSAGDAIGMMTGETSKLANMDERMVQLAKNLKAQYGGNVFALKEMAAQYGMTLEQVQSLSQLNAEDLRTQQDRASLEEQANKARASMVGELQKVWNLLNVIMQAFVMPLLNLVTPILSAITSAVKWVGDLFVAMKKVEGPLGAVFKVLVDGLGFVTGALVLAGLLGLSKGIFGLINPLKLVGGGFKGIKDSIGGIIKGAKGALTSLLKLKKASPAEGIAGAAGRSPAPAGPAPAMDKAGKGGGFFDKLAKVDAVKILAIGAAIFLIAAGIALIVLAVSQLAKAMAALNPEQLNALLAMMAIIMGGMVLVILAFSLAIFILGSVGTVAAVGIIAVGLAIFLIAAGVAIVVLSIALLISVIANSAEGMGAFSLVIANLIPLFAGMALGIMMVGMAMVMLGAYAPFALAGLAVLAGMGVIMLLMIPVVSKLGEAFSNMGLGIKNMAEFGVSAIQNLLALRDTMNSIGGGFADSFVSQINAMADAMSRLSGVSMIVAATMKIMGNIGPSASTTEPANANTESITTLIAESNSYLSAIMTNTDKIVKILSDKKSEPARPRSVASRPVKLEMAKEGI